MIAEWSYYWPLLYYLILSTRCLWRPYEVTLLFFRLLRSFCWLCEFTIFLLRIKWFFVKLLFKKISSSVFAWRIWIFDILSAFQFLIFTRSKLWSHVDFQALNTFKSEINFAPSFNFSVVYRRSLSCLKLLEKFIAYPHGRLELTPISIWGTWSYFFVGLSAVSLSSERTQYTSIFVPI